MKDLYEEVGRWDVALNQRASKHDPFLGRSWHYLALLGVGQPVRQSYFKQSQAEPA